jgi:hypothetical protein
MFEKILSGHHVENRMLEVGVEEGDSEDLRTAY